MPVASAGVVSRLFAGLTGWRARRRPVVGVYGLPRGGTNFVSAALHYHPRVFCISEREHDWHRPLERYWQRRSIFREHGVQDKDPGLVDRVVFNKVQRFPKRWGAQVAYPEGTRFIFYLRNPIRVFHSRQTYHDRHEPFRDEWTATAPHFERLLDEVAELLMLHERLSARHPCLFWTHEHFCVNYAESVADSLRFLDIESIRLPEPQAFFRSCGSCGRPFTSRCVGGEVQFWCADCNSELRGYGHFNPLRPIDATGVASSSWNERPGTDRLMDRVRARLGAGLADYYWAGDYSRNLVMSRPMRRAA
jgi:hypothetical protein